MIITIIMIIIVSLYNSNKRYMALERYQNNEQIKIPGLNGYDIFLLSWGLISVAYIVIINFYSLHIDPSDKNDAKVAALQIIYVTVIVFGILTSELPVKCTYIPIAKILINKGGEPLTVSEITVSKKDKEIIFFPINRKPIKYKYLSQKKFDDIYYKLKSSCQKQEAENR